MATTGASLLTSASILLLDEDRIRWPLPELVGWINEAQRAIVLAKPSAKSESVVISLIAGTLQSLTNTDHLALLRIPRNIVTEGPPRVGGRAIRPTTRELLDASSPGWHEPDTFAYKKDVRQYVYDEESPREFYVFPGNLGTGKIEAVVSVLPTRLTASGDVHDIDSYGASIGLPEPYAPVILDWVLYRAFSKDSMEADTGRAQLHYQAYATALGLKVQAERAYSPNTKARVQATG